MSYQPSNEHRSGKNFPDHGSNSYPNSYSDTMHKDRYNVPPKQEKPPESSFRKKTQSLLPRFRTIDSKQRPTPRQIAELSRAAQAGSKQAIAALQGFLIDSPFQETRVAAAEALGMLGDCMPVAYLLLALTDPYWDVRAAAVQSLSSLGTNMPVNHLIARLSQETDMSVREEIVRALGQLKDAMPVPLLQQLLLKDRSFLVRDAVVWALGQLQDKAPTSLLIYSMLFDKSEQVRATAATVLGNSSRWDVITPLYMTLQDNDEEVRVAASHALQKLGNEQEKEFAVDTLQDSHAALPDHDIYLNASLLSWRNPLWDAFMLITDYIKNKRGKVDVQLKETNEERILLFKCFYEQSQEILSPMLLPSLQELPFVQPIETALQSGDQFVQAMVREALESKTKQEWYDLFVVSFFVYHVSEDQECVDHRPLRIIISCMGGPVVHGHDTASVLDQLATRWVETSDEPLSCTHVHDIGELHVWYQSATP